MKRGFGDNHYVPLLKTKQGELKALAELKTESKENLTPLLELHRQDYDFEAEVTKKTLERHLSDVLNNVASSWEGRPFFFDYYLYYLSLMDDETPAVSFISSLLQEKELLAIPVVRVPHFRLNDVCELVRSTPQFQENGACLRVFVGDFEDEEFVADIESCLSILDTSPSNIDLIIDYESNMASIGMMASVLKTTINSLPLLEDWRSLTLAGTSFPKDTSGVSQNEPAHIMRGEWSLWKLLRTPAKLPDRSPTFGDYSISHSEIFEGDPSKINAPVHLRYTLDSEWLIRKWGGLRGGGAANFPLICQALVASEKYHGVGFSWGDERIYEHSQDTSKKGNTTMWRQIGVNHHLEKVVSQIQLIAG